MQSSDWDEPSTVLRSTLSPTPPSRTSYRLLVTSGPGEGTAVVVEPSAPPMWIGQSHVCGFRLADQSVSRRHARVTPLGGALRLVDHGSTNGTRISGVRVLDALLYGGERIELGETHILVERLEQDKPPSIPTTTRFGRLLGVSTEIRCLYPLFEQLARTDVSLVIEGETGTGKEVLAESIHEMGPRARGPFVVFDCTAIAPSLLEPELFGHERGAFTGAHIARPGLLEQADGGTLLIDELGDLDPTLQPKLLRALERKEVRRLGASQARRFDVRIICATRRDLDAEVAAGRFRDDLYHRLAIASIELPPLRARRGEVGYLARMMWRELGGHPDGPPLDLVARWEAEQWPGNVRELRNAVARTVALGDLAAEGAGRRERASDAPLPPPLGVTPSAGHDYEQLLSRGLPLAAARAVLLEEFERRYIERLLAAHDGNVTKAAAAAGISRRYLHRLKARGC